ncbi:MAG: TetR/AcrR family transcriptional regulator [Marmoricola sp.]
MTPRAAPMSTEDRRQALVQVTIPLLREHGRSVTTRQIAEAAGVAEGTIFRVFDSKEELIDYALHRAFSWGDLIERIDAIDIGLPLEERLLELVTLLQSRFQAIFGLMRSVGMVAPPKTGEHAEERERWLRQVRTSMVRLVKPDAALFTMSAAEVVNVVRLLTFSGSHPEMTQGQLLKPAEIVGVVLHGVLKENP